MSDARQVRPPHKPAEIGQRIFTARQAREFGLTAQQLQGASWRRLLRNVHVDAAYAARHDDDEHALRANAATMAIPPYAVIAGLSAAWLYGVKLLARRAPVEIALSKDVHFGPVAGLKIWRATFAAGDLIWDHPRRTTPLRTAWDIACRVDIPDAVAALDVFLARGLVTQAALVAMAGEPGRWRRRRAKQVIELVDAQAESPQESRLRVLLLMAGLPRPECQHEIKRPVGKGEQFVARVDLAWPKQRVAVEYDGHWHGAPDQLRRDRARLNRILTAGWLVIHVTDDRLRQDAPELIREIRQILRQRT